MRWPCHLRPLPLKGGGSGWRSRWSKDDPHPTAGRSTSPFQGERKKEAFAPTASLSQKPVRPHHGAPHVRRRRVVEAKAFLRLAEIAPDDVDEIVEIHLHVRVKRIDVVDADQPRGHVPLVIPRAL